MLTLRSPPGYYNPPPAHHRNSIPPPPPTPPPEPEVKSHGFFSGGWRSGVTYAAIATFVVFLINLSVTLWANNKYGNVDGLGVLQHGGCAKIKRSSLWIHLAINALSTALLSASNYTSQTLSAPTRKEIDRAHARRRWLDIGVSSLRNLGKISWTRFLLWLFLMLSSVPLHFLCVDILFQNFPVLAGTVLT